MGNNTSLTQDKFRKVLEYEEMDDEGRLILSQEKIQQDVERYRLPLKQGLHLRFYTKDGQGHYQSQFIDGIVEFNSKINEWVARIDKREIKEVSPTRIPRKFMVSMESYFQNRPIIYIDFHGECERGKFVLDTLGTKKDLERYGITLSEGLRLTFWSDDTDDQGNFDPLIVEGTVEFNSKINEWVARIDDTKIRHDSQQDH